MRLGAGARAGAGTRLHRGAPGVGLEAAAAPARAAPAALADDGVADLAGAAAAVPGLAVEDHAWRWCRAPSRTRCRRRCRSSSRPARASRPRDRCGRPQYCRPFFPSLWRGLRCRIVTSWPACSNSFTSAWPMNRVPPITSTFRLAGSWRLDPLVVVLEPKVCNQVLSAHPAQRVLQLHQLNENVVLGIQARQPSWEL